ncbi:MAG: tetratricopeptide repeat protein, partial [Planctomycetes bacterium]|nr:tetratricopeptide repeat protein [Planctomycetota bacterium]
MAVTRTGKRCREIAVVLAVILTIVGDPGTPTAQGELATPRAAGGPPSAGMSRAQAAAIFRSAAALQNRELHDLAEAEWASLVEHFPNDPLVGKARYYRGVCLVRLERYADAEAEFGRVVAEQAGLDATLIEQSFANLGLAQYRRARLAAGEEQAKAFDAAIATLGQQLERFPAGRFATQAHFYRAEACYERQDVASALADYQAVVTEHGDPALRPRALYGLGVVQQELGNPAEAGRAFDVFLQEFPLDALAAEVHFRRGEWRAATGDEDGAVRDFQRISERWPESPFAPQALLRQSHLEQQGRDFALAQATLGRFLVNYRDHELAFQARLLRATVR